MRIFGEVHQYLIPSVCTYLYDFRKDATGWNFNIFLSDWLCVWISNVPPPYVRISVHLPPCPSTTPPPRTSKHQNTSGKNFLLINFVFLSSHSELNLNILFHSVCVRECEITEFLRNRKILFVKSSLFRQKSGGTKVPWSLSIFPRICRTLRLVFSLLITISNVKYAWYQKNHFKIIFGLNFSIWKCSVASATAAICHLTRCVFVQQTHTWIWKYSQHVERAEDIRHKRWKPLKILTVSNFNKIEIKY